MLFKCKIEHCTLTAQKCDRIGKMNATLLYPFFFLHTVVFSLEPAGPVCEGSGTVPVCVVLQTDIQVDVTVTISTANGFATGNSIYTHTIINFVFQFRLFLILHLFLQNLMIMNLNLV